MEKNFIILDFDPGVDDALCFLSAAFDPQIDIKLVAIEHGNIPLEQTLKNTFFLAKKANLTVPVVVGAPLKKRTDKEGLEAQKRAEAMHSKTSLGGIQIPQDIEPCTLNADVADAMFEIIKKHPHQVSIVGCAPLTSIKHLFDKHPESKKLLKQIVFMGGSFGLPGSPTHISYNAGANPLAYAQVVSSGVKCVVVPSLIGRTKARFTKEQVDKLSKLNAYGKFLADMFQTYWEIGFDEQFVSNNDVCTYLYLVAPEIFKTQNVDISVDLNEHPGKLSKKPNPKSPVSLVTDLDRRKFLGIMFKKIKETINFDYQ